MVKSFSLFNQNKICNMLVTLASTSGNILDAFFIVWRFIPSRRNTVKRHSKMFPEVEICDAVTLQFSTSVELRPPFVS